MLLNSCAIPPASVHGLQAVRLRKPRLQRFAFRLGPRALDGVGEYLGGGA